MATVTVTNSVTRLTSADATTGWSSDGGGGAGPQTEPDLGYQKTSGSNWSVSRKVGTSKGGHAYTHGSTTDMTAASTKVLMAKGVWYNNINTSPYPACGLRIGNSSSNHYEYAVYASDNSLPQFNPDPKILFRIIPIDPNVSEWPAVITGTVTLTTIDFFGIQGDFGGSAKAENVAMDAIDLVGDDGVLFLVGGDGADFDGSFQSFLNADEGNITTRWGFISTARPSILDVYGKLWIGRNSSGTATATEFIDSNLTILFPAGYYGEEWTGIGVDLGNASTAVTISDMSFIGQGQARERWYTRTVDDVNNANDDTRVTPDWGEPNQVEDGIPVLYSKEGGSHNIGLTDATVYWARLSGTAQGSWREITLYSTRDAAFLAGTPVNLTAASGVNESHSFTVQPDTRPILDITGTSGTVDFARCSFDSFKKIITTSAATFDSCTFRSCREIDMTTNNGGVFDTCNFIITRYSTLQGEALITTNTTANIDNCVFTKSRLFIGSDEIENRVVGHAIDIDTAGSYALDGNTFAGDAWWTSPDNEKGAEFNTTSGGGVDDTNNDITTTSAHGFATGEPVYYNDNGGTDTIGLTDGAKYYVNVISTTNFSLHLDQGDAQADNDRVGLNNTGTGEIHTFYSSQACIVNSSGGAVTLTVGGGGDTPSIRNIGASTTTLILNPVTLTVKCVDANTGANLQNVRVLVVPSDNTGPLDYEETVSITSSGTTATVTKTGHGYATNDLIQIRGANENAYNCVATITVTGANTFTYTMPETAASPATGSPTATQAIIFGLTNASGEITANFALSMDQPVEGNCRLSTTSPLYATGRIPAGTNYDSAANTTLNVPMIPDE